MDQTLYPVHNDKYKPKQKTMDSHVGRKWEKVTNHPLLFLNEN